MRKLHGFFYSRIFIPKDLQEYFPKAEYQFSLRTQDRKFAESCQQNVKAEAGHLFSLIRHNLLETDQIPKAISKIRAFQTGRVRESAQDHRVFIRGIYPSFVSEKMNSCEWKEKTRQETQTCINLFLDIVGEKTVIGYSHGDLLYFRECLLKLPPAFQKMPELKKLTI